VPLFSCSYDPCLCVGRGVSPQWAPLVGSLDWFDFRFHHWCLFDPFDVLTYPLSLVLVLGLPNIGLGFQSFTGESFAGTWLTKEST